MTSIGDDMPRYRSHKIVRAAPVAGYPVAAVAGNIVLEIAGEPKTVSVPAAVFARGKPAVGDYLVVYDDGEYVSWSPKKVFEDGYTHIEG